MKYIKQFRYYGDNDSRNYPYFANYYGTLVGGNILHNYGAVSHLGVQGMPGTKFYLNNSPFPITIGRTGIYELDLEGMGQITAIRFDRDSVEMYRNPSSPADEVRLLVDIIYEGAGVNA